MQRSCSRGSGEVTAREQVSGGVEHEPARRAGSAEGAAAVGGARDPDAEPRVDSGRVEVASRGGERHEVRADERARDLDRPRPGPPVVVAPADDGRGPMLGEAPLEGDVHGAARVDGERGPVVVAVAPERPGHAGEVPRPGRRVALGDDRVRRQVVVAELPGEEGEVLPSGAVDREARGPVRTGADGRVRPGAARPAQPAVGGDVDRIVVRGLDEQIGVAGGDGDRRLGLDAVCTGDVDVAPAERPRVVEVRDAVAVDEQGAERDQRGDDGGLDGEAARRLGEGGRPAPPASPAVVSCRRRPHDAGRARARLRRGRGGGRRCGAADPPRAAAAARSWRAR